jgi:hypothetical protein
MKSKELAEKIGITAIWDHKKGKNSTGIFTGFLFFQSK